MATVTTAAPVAGEPPPSLASPHPGVAERAARGREARRRLPRGTHGDWRPAADRPDPIALLEAQATTRVPQLVPIRYGRMLASPFAFLRGSAIVMAHDLARTPVSGIDVQCCGDAHVSNFGVYASPERRLLFDINDFDETLPGPWEWDVKRLAASLVVAGRGNGFSRADCRDTTLAAMRGYREAMNAYARMSNLDVWYSRIGTDEIMALLRTGEQRKRLQRHIERARSRTSLGSLDKLTTVVDGQRRIIESPPVVVRPTADTSERVQTMIRDYAATLEESRRHLLAQYRVVDVARKVVGVGSVGTRTSIALFEGRDAADPLFLQVKEAQPSVLGAVLPHRYAGPDGARVVAGQRLMQAASDIFLGWVNRGPGDDYYVRQLRDMKLSIDMERIQPPTLRLTAALCGAALARAHARSGDRVAIAAYIGQSERFDNALADFAAAYADQTERDHAALVRAVHTGRIAAETGV